MNEYDIASLIEELPDDLFKYNPLIEQLASTFMGCHSLRKVPVSSFDNNRKIKSFSQTFSGCYELEGESPYTIIDGVKYHLYERTLATDYFFKPDCHATFRVCTKLIDFDSMPNDCL